MATILTLQLLIISGVEICSKLMAILLYDDLYVCVCHVCTGFVTSDSWKETYFSTSAFVFVR